MEEGLSPLERVMKCFGDDRGRLDVEWSEPSSGVEAGLQIRWGKDSSSLSSCSDAAATPCPCSVAHSMDSNQENSNQEHLGHSHP